MNVEDKTLQLVKNTLSSIDVVMEDWKSVDKGIKSRYVIRVKRLKKWKAILETWKKDFLKTEESQRYRLLLELHEIMVQMGWI